MVVVSHGAGVRYSSAPPSTLSEKRDIMNGIVGMSHEKITGPLSISCAVGGGTTNYPLTPRPGGRSTKTVQYMVKVVDFRGSAPTLGFIIAHGPDATVSVTHASVAVAAVSGTTPILFVFDCGATPLGEYLHPVVRVGGSATGDSVVIEVWETRKPF